MTATTRNRKGLTERIAANKLEVQRLKGELARAEEEAMNLRRELLAPVPPQPKTAAQCVAQAQAKAAALISGTKAQQGGSAMEAQPHQDTTAGNSPAAVHAAAATPGVSGNS